MNLQYGVNSSHQKRKNHGLVLKMIATREANTRVDISQKIGLTKMAVTNIVGELMKQGYICEKETSSNACVGRNPVILDIAVDAPKTVSIYISRLTLTVILSDIKLGVLYIDRYSLDKETNETFNVKLRNLCDGAFEYCHSEFPNSLIAGIGVSSIGPIDSREGIILRPFDFFNIANFHIGQILSERYSVPVFTNNDMNAAALAENLYGYGKEYPDFIYIGLTAGVGAGIVSEGELYHNRSSFVGEIGHYSVDGKGKRCICGQRGCLELYASMTQLIENLRSATGRNNLEYCDIEKLDRIKECHTVLNEFVGYVSQAVTSIVNILAPSCIIIGHEGYYLPDSCLKQIENYVNSNILAKKYYSVDIVKSSFGEKAPMLGSACCVWQELFDGNLFNSIN